MGNICGGKGPVIDADPEQKRQNRIIDDEIKAAKKLSKKEIKLLLLGTGEAGKSTFAKQMKILHLQGFTQEECVASKPIIFCNIFDSCHKLIRAAKNQFQYDIPDELTEAVDYLENVDLAEDLVINQKVANYIKDFWKDSNIQQTYSRAAEFQLNDSTKYFFEAIDRVAKPDYIPSEEDMLRLRNKTSGVIETCFSCKGLNFRMVDVGGQRNERRKWYHCFAEVDSVIFLVALSEYNIFLEEEETTNRMKESITLFRDVINNQWFKNTSIMLFLNKKDLFEEKIARGKNDPNYALTVCFTTYKGPSEFKDATDYIKKRFVDNNLNPERTVFVHLTCATDKKNAEKVFNSVQYDIINTVMKKKLDIG